MDGVPQLAAYDGQTTLGVLVTNDGKVVSLQSGNGNPAYSNYIASSHVEGQAALWMGENGSSSGTVYINNTNGICGYCNAQISTLLPEGSTLTVGRRLVMKWRKLSRRNRPVNTVLTASREVILSQPESSE